MKKGQSGIAHPALLLLALVIAGIGFTGWFVWQNRQQDKVSSFEECVAAGNPVAESFPEQCSADGRTFVNEKQADTQRQRTMSTNNKFSLLFPEGWKGILNDKERDFFLIKGENQQEVRPGQEPEIEITNICCSGPAVLSVDMRESSGGSLAMGRREEFVIDSKESARLTGYKYFFEYTEDTATGEGDEKDRLKGDKDYYYVFDTGNGEVLTVTYSVYGSDPRNFVKQIDYMVQSIRLEN